MCHYVSIIQFNSCQIMTNLASLVTHLPLSWNHAEENAGIIQFYS